MKYVSTINLKELILFHKNTNDSLFLLTLLCTCLCHMLSLSIMIRTLDYCDDDVLWIWYQCVMKPKIWAKPNPKLFSDTNFFQYRIRYFFLYQFFSKQILILLSIPKIFETETDTFFDTKKFRNWYQYFLRDQIFFETDTDTIKKHGKVSKPNLKLFRSKFVDWIMSLL